MELKAFDIKRIVKGILFAFIFSIVAIGILTAAVFFSDISDRTIKTVIFIISALSAFLGALLAARNVPARGLLHGLVVGIGYFAIITILSLAISSSTALNSRNILRFAAVLAAGMLGGTLGINSKGM